MTAERRRHPRVQLAVDVDLDSDNNFFAGRTRDISQGGLFIEAAIGLPEGTELVIQLQLESERVELPCVVVWHVTDAGGGLHGFGVEFRHLPAAARASIDAFMQRRAPLEFEMSVESEGAPKPPPLPT